MDSNHRHPDLQSGALPTELLTQIVLTSHIHAMLIHLLFYNAKIHIYFELKKLYSKNFQESLIIVLLSIARLIQRMSIIALS